MEELSERGALDDADVEAAWIAWLVVEVTADALVAQVEQGAQGVGVGDAEVIAGEDADGRAALEGGAERAMVATPLRMTKAARISMCWALAMRGAGRGAGRRWAGLWSAR